MRLFIAEKPSLARAIAEALPGPRSRSRTHITCAGGNVVAWCAGHILEVAPPEAYAAQWKRWRLCDLPILPGDWKLQASTPELLKAIQLLLAAATRVVHAGDPDREGQLLVDEVLSFLRYKGPVDRLLVQDLRPEAVAAQLGALEPNAKYRPLYESALARQRADWLFGINMSRLYTLLGQAAGYDGVLSVGRVQTPLLGLIVARDRAIAEFRPVPYFTVVAAMRTAGGETFRALWTPAASVEPHLDEDKRLLRRDVAEAAADRLRGQSGAVSVRTVDKRIEPPPLPYALADLQMDAGRRLGLSAQAVLDACQSLYETHRLTTYPRSDCSHLPEGHYGQAKDVLVAIATHAPGLAAAAARADLSLRSKAWNDKKVTAHHAIIPTPGARSAPAHLSETERAVYELIARRYIGQFYAAHEYLQTKVDLFVAGERLTASGRRVVSLGWKALVADVEGDDKADGASKESDFAPPTAPLPDLSVGDTVTVSQADVSDKKTQPPKPFTDASLIAAMCAVAKYVSDPKIKKILSDADGIGTPATRAAIIETLFDRGYVTRAKKTIVSTDTGRALIGALPRVATTPDMTAVWEAAMQAIVDEKQSLGAFLDCISAELRTLVADGRRLGSIRVPPSARSSSSSTARASAPRSEAPKAKRSFRTSRTRSHAS